MLPRNKSGKYARKHTSPKVKGSRGSVTMVPPLEKVQERYLGWTGRCEKLTP